MQPKVNEINIENQPKSRVTKVSLSPAKLGESIFEEAGKYIALSVNKNLIF